MDNGFHAGAGALTVKAHGTMAGTIAAKTRRQGSIRAARWAAAGFALLFLSGCAQFRKQQEEKYVYVTSKEATLSDRFAAVSNHVGTVANGDKLTVVERGRHALKVKTAQGVIGWIKEMDVADQETADKFDQLKKDHAKDPVVATATALNDVYLHDSPGRKTDHFYRLSEGDSMSLLERASVEKPQPPGTPVAAAAAPAAGADPAAAPAGPPMEDWWLVRDTKGNTGWIYSRLIDVSAPDTVSRYAEGQRIVGAYLLTKVDDPDSGMIDNGQPVTQIPEYVTVLGPYKAGLPYDFDQIRVFTWNLKKHRYETAFREKNVEGYLPVIIDQRKNPYLKDAIGAVSLPSFTYKVLAADSPAPVRCEDGVMKPGRLITKTYRLEGNICRRVIAPNVPPQDVAHPVAEVKKDKKDAKKRKR
ncbi:hypothetical protein SAMN05421819_2588 [Bryocella elongata]|uniref:SH3 domain-containing protein n=1 Tax=Bryocella elongata TaxID=863522 RepID=A0A1H5ZCV3_9BACT|nr:SH3 domain-containing protein [Bryocella elongata]SEG34228.1 hypothetical protein SAMN05421819_2588 [Bryocella elongata]